MAYIVMERYTAKKDSDVYTKGDVMVYYMGKGGCPHRNIAYVEGWKRHRFAEEYIKKAKEWHEKYDKNYWDIEYFILTTD